jgi:hypothetical protein
MLIHEQSVLSSRCHVRGRSGSRTDRSIVSDDKSPRLPESDEPPDTPGSVIASIAAGVGPLPFLLMYSVIFISHGFFYPVEPPDITSTRGGEAVAGVLAVLVSLVIVLTIWWFLNGRRRWTFVLGQLAVLVTTIAFVANPKTGSPTVPLVLIVTSVTALVFAFFPNSNAYLGRGTIPMPLLRGRRSVPGKSGESGESGEHRTDELPALRIDDHSDASVS